MKRRWAASMAFLIAAFPTAGDTAGPRAFSASELGFLLGHWHGSGTFAATGKPVTSSLEVDAYADGQVIGIREQEDRPNTFAYLGSITLDSQRGALVMLMAGNNSGGARLFRSDGATRQQVVFVADPALHAWFGLERLTFARIGDKRLSSTYEFSRDGLHWTVGDRQTYVRDQG